jgi:hypothetical protein
MNEQLIGYGIIVLAALAIGKLAHGRMRRAAEACQRARSPGAPQ